MGDFRAIYTSFYHTIVPPFLQDFPIRACRLYIFLPPAHPKRERGNADEKHGKKPGDRGACGTGLFLVPLFTKWLGMEQRKAFATSVAVILPLSAVSLAVFVLKGGLDFMAALPYLIGGLAGGILSGLVFQKVPVTLLRRAFGLLILYGGVKALFLL